LQWRSGVDDNTRVRFVRATDRRLAAERLQVWKSETTGHEFYSSSSYGGW
jgi:hypothetical protein